MQIKREGTEIAIFTVISVLLYQSGFLIFVFCVPLQLLFFKQGNRAFLISTGLFILSVILWGFVKTRGVADSETRWMILCLDAGLPILFFLGLAAVNNRIFPFKSRLYSLLSAAAGFALLSLPVFFLVRNSEGIVGFLENQILQSMRVFFQISLPSPGESESGSEQIAAIVALIKEGFFRNYVFVFFLILTGNYRAGMLISARSKGETWKGLWEFHLDDRFVWPFLISWAGVLAGLYLDLGFFQYLVWNVGLITLFLFGIQGIGIIQFITLKYGIAPRLKMLGMFLVVILLMVPKLNMLIYVGIPVLGVTELWIKYRVIERSKDR